MKYERQRGQRGSITARQKEETKMNKFDIEDPFTRQVGGTHSSTVPSNRE